MTAPVIEEANIGFLTTIFIILSDLVLYYSFRHLRLDIQRISKHIYCSRERFYVVLDIERMTRFLEEFFDLNMSNVSLESDAIMN